MEFFVGLVAVLSLATSAFLVHRVLELERRLQSLPQPALQPLPEPPRRPLQGLRIGLAITQDHPHPVFANLLREQLLSEDVTEITLLTPAESTRLQSDWKQRTDGPDILIGGDIVCNSYAEIYYTAELTCSPPHPAICTPLSNPTHRAH